ncbi:MAG: hypothetical protein OER77_10645, partial [Myxococcales bacterium]|nr:hypothetical protein [Myxococcales bacterium]
GEPVFLVYDGTVFRLPAAGAGGSDDFGAGDPGANGLMSRDALNSSIARAIAAGVGTAIAVVNGDGVAGNPSLAVDISLETEEASPAAGDMLLIEQLVGGTLRRVPWSSLPGAAETNSLETVVTGVLADEVLVGDSADTGTFRPLPSCSVGATDKLLYNTTTNTFTCGTDGGGAETNSLETLLTAVLDDEIPVGDSLDNATFRVLPSCSTGGTDKLLYNSTTNTFSCGTDQNSGGSAHTQENIEDLQVTRTTTPVLTINTPASVSIGNSSTALSADATIDVTGGTETACTARIYVSEARALTVALSTAQCATDATVTNIAEVQASVFPDTSIPLYTWTLSGAAAWNASGTNHRGPRRDVVKGGTRINEAYVDGILSLSLGTVLVEDVENDLKTFFDCQNLVDFSTAIPATADIPSMWGEFPFAFQLTKVWCEVEENTATINLQRDDGAPADMLSSDLVCDTTEQDSCASGCDVNTIAAAEDNVAVGEQIDFNVVSIGADVNRINLCISGLVE